MVRLILEPVISHECDAGWLMVAPGLSRVCECRLRPLEAP